CTALLRAGQDFFAVSQMIIKGRSKTNRMIKLYHLPKCHTIKPFSVSLLHGVAVNFRPAAERAETKVVKLCSVIFCCSRSPFGYAKMSNVRFMVYFLHSPGGRVKPLY